ncbi:pinin, desmosome associated protein [Reticulomyxa filosa]|uniref:Pinin, desmosome associated protein n=1 Tax=Reticulomyxa filosa TaxID=46433 RepID=X6NT53_RETFI|nr:pinin, desmosome associated protein [Reticulomyxa filosa]|eukprot:ETO28487.1 pinin, desmosome associated protein [Reticulomyxa filosa]
MYILCLGNYIIKLKKSGPTDHRKSIHHQWNSNVPMLTHAQDVEMIEEEGTEDENEKTPVEIQKLIRKELSSIIENLTEMKLRRLQNMKDYWNKEIHDESKLIEIEKEFEQTEGELAQWRRNRSLHEEQEHKIERRHSLVISGIATEMDLIADEELVKSFAQYDPKDDFIIVKSRFVDLNRLYWFEDQLVTQRFKHYEEQLDPLAITQLPASSHKHHPKPSDTPVEDLSSQESETDSRSKTHLHHSSLEPKHKLPPPPVVGETDADEFLASSKNISVPIHNKDVSSQGQRQHQHKGHGNNATEEEEEENDEEEEEDGANDEWAKNLPFDGKQNEENPEHKKIKASIKFHMRRFTETHHKEIDTFIAQIQRKDRQMQLLKDQIAKMQQQIDQLTQAADATANKANQTQHKQYNKSTDIVDELRHITTTKYQAEMSSLHEDNDEVSSDVDHNAVTRPHEIAAAQTLQQQNANRLSQLQSQSQLQPQPQPQSQSQSQLQPQLQSQPQPQPQSRDDNGIEPIPVPEDSDTDPAPKVVIEHRKKPSERSDFDDVSHQAMITAFHEAKRSATSPTARKKKKHSSNEEDAQNNNANTNNNNEEQEGDFVLSNSTSRTPSPSPIAPNDMILPPLIDFPNMELSSFETRKTENYLTYTLSIYLYIYLYVYVVRKFLEIFFFFFFFFGKF